MPAADISRYRSSADGDNIVVSRAGIGHAALDIPNRARVDGNGIVVGITSLACATGYVRKGAGQSVDDDGIAVGVAARNARISAKDTAIAESAAVDNHGIGAGVR